MGTAEILASRIFDLQKLLPCEILAENRKCISDTRIFWLDANAGIILGPFLYLCSDRGQWSGIRILECDAVCQILYRKTRQKIENVADQAAIAIEKPKYLQRQIVAWSKLPDKWIHPNDAQFKQLDDVLANCQKKSFQCWRKFINDHKMGPENK